MSNLSEIQSYDFSQLGGFQPLPGYRDFDRKPQVVVSYTHTILDLYQHNLIRKTELAKEYLSGYTLPFLNAASEGADYAYSKLHNVTPSQDVEANEAAGFTKLVFDFLPFSVNSPDPRMAVIRKSLVPVPTKKDEYLGRIGEVRKELGLIVSGLRDVSEPLEVIPPTFRTYSFFRVGKDLPLHVPDSGRDQLAMADETSRKQAEDAARRKKNEMERAKKAFEEFLGKDLKVEL